MAGRKRREPDLLAYTDFRKYLRDYYAFRKSQDRRYSYGVFAKRAGIPVRWHLKGVLDYGRNLTPDTLGKYRRALGLAGPKGEYFALLVALDQASDPESEEEARGALQRWRMEHLTTRLSRPEADSFFSRLSTVLVGALWSEPGFRKDPAWISRRLLGAVTPAEAMEALEFYRTWRGRGAILHEDADGLEGFRRQLLRTAARRTNRRMGYGGSTNVYLARLTREQAVELDRKLDRWLKANLPAAGGPDAQLCALVGDVFALTGPV